MMTQTLVAILRPGVIRLTLAVAAGLGARVGAAQVVGVPERAEYTPLDAGADAYQQGESRRLAQINGQIGLNQQMRWRWSGISSFYPGVFEAWPMVPGDIWGYPLPYPIRQSIGQRSYQAGPNRWISEPVYPEDLASPETPSSDSGQQSVLPPGGLRAALPADPTDLFGGPARAAPGAGAAPPSPSRPQLPSPGPREF